MQWNVSLTQILLIALWPWGRLSLLQKWVPGVLPGCKCGRCIRLDKLTTILYCLSRNVGTFTSWKSLGHSGPVRGLLYLFIRCSISALRSFFFTLAFNDFYTYTTEFPIGGSDSRVIRTPLPLPYLPDDQGTGLPIHHSWGDRETGLKCIKA
jgi:hypothetical protein